MTSLEKFKAMVDVVELKKAFGQHANIVKVAQSKGRRPVTMVIPIQTYKCSVYISSNIIHNNDAVDYLDLPHLQVEKVFC